MSPRTVIHRATLEDGPEFLAAAAASRSLHGEWIAPPSTPEAWAAYVRTLDGERKVGFLARRSSDGALAGWLNLSEIIRGALQSCFLGYAGFAATAGQGHMTEAMELVLREAFVDLGLHRVEANIQPGNTRSLALAARCGFEKEGFSPRYLQIAGHWRDHERWAIRVETWRARRGSRP